ncbi:YciI family protein [Maridesulfovibrio ferrireducens]|nr:hypothetical protein [Maridesulfovibrio ferrireducens]
MKKDTTQTYVYFYFMKKKPEIIKQAAPDHAKYWMSLKLDGYKGGPFADRSGGMILFKAKSKESASMTVAGDPFVIHDLIGESWLKPWVAH